MPTALRVDADGEPLRLLCTHAHPDDESSKGAATMIKYSAEGVRVVVVTLTGGERGEILNPRLNTPENVARLPELREAEMKAARQILGIEQIWLGYEDSGFFQVTAADEWPETPPGTLAAAGVDEAAHKLVPIIRAIRPHVVVTYDERGGYPHPDHIMTHRVTMAALPLAADETVSPESGVPWQVSKVYYHMGFHQQRFARLDALMAERGLKSPYAARLRSWHDDEAIQRITTRVPCAEYFGIRDQALLAHATQVDPEGPWFAVPLEIQQLGWPTEDYQLVSSTIDAGDPEYDLFAGLAYPAPRD